MILLEINQFYFSLENRSVMAPIPGSGSSGTEATTIDYAIGPFPFSSDTASNAVFDVVLSQPSEDYADQTTGDSNPESQFRTVKKCSYRSSQYSRSTFLHEYIHFVAIFMVVSIDDTFEYILILY